MESRPSQHVDLPTAAPSLSSDRQEDETSAPSTSSSPECQSSTSQSAPSNSTHDQSTRPHHSRNINRRESCQSLVRKSFSWSKSIFHPRSYEEIYAEQAYLSITLQAHTAHFCDLIQRYSLTEVESFQGESRKCKRRARRELGLLRGQLVQAAGQEQAIFARLGELFLEARSRETWNVAHNQRRQSLPILERHTHSQDNQDTRFPSLSILNGASPVFVPQKELFSPREREYDKDAMSTTDTSDNEEGKQGVQGSGNSLCELKMDPVLEPDDAEPDEQRPALRRMSGDDCASTLKRDRRLSLPTKLEST
ncbi:uncharacterized protein MAM_02641 [Metarhizium album ARSEF 1941]|uniref:Uncharacterized protein n=1 Tax=Metarhizium album (strain ARSEF 1941) TaxID=1081103 RepID=A0A0B2X0I5_METAS|nr:uncharacterized protein MAM_02641 [Metarhizium album ARSEF 1941]KHN99788.1 hypothetical protein MAM_02641 [Metarhizium album ARSEF 1941]